MINVLIVEDSPVARELLVRILKTDPKIQVIGTVKNGTEALDFITQQKPDVITMDINMPQMDGIETTRRIMETLPVPIVIVSGAWNPSEVQTTFRAVEAGAVALVEKPRGPGHPDAPAMAEDLVRTVKNMSEVRVIRRWARRDAQTRTASTAAPPNRTARTSSLGSAFEVVAIGISTGGPPVLQTILQRLPKNFPVPILIVQHISAGFLHGMADWLNKTTGFPIHIAAHEEKPLPGCAYLAPDGAQMGLSANGCIELTDAPPENGLRPAASCLFRSVAKVYGAKAIGILLTGMGRDGAAELKTLRDKGAITIAQDEASSVIHGMPGEAIRLGAAMYVLPPEKIADMLEVLAKSRPA